MQPDRGPKDVGDEPEAAAPEEPDHSGQPGDRLSVSHDAIHHVQGSVTIDRPLDDVFTFVSDPTNDAKWRPDVAAARSASEGPPGVGSTFTWILKAPVESEAEMEIELAECEPNRRVRIRTLSGAMRPELTYLFQPAGAATRVTRVVNVTCGPQYMEPAMRKIIEERNAAYLANLKAVLEGQPEPSG